MEVKSRYGLNFYTLYYLYLEFSTVIEQFVLQSNVSGFKPRYSLDFSVIVDAGGIRSRYMTLKYIVQYDCIILT